MSEQMRKANLVQREFYDGHGIAVVTIDVPEADTLLEQHQHDISHVSFVAAGSVLPIVDGKTLPKLSAGHAMTVEAFKTHMFQTLEPNTRLLCITNTLGEESEKHRRVPGGPRVIPQKFAIEN